LSESSQANPTLISVVVPLYNEEENVRPLVERLDRVFKQIGCPWEVVFAFDPSPDRTRERIQELLDEGFPIRLITFSRRIGKPLSLLAGLDHARGDACVIIDADLQDPPELIVKMVEK
jgi:glycosyltransferase involved in cell wall biosynthesis